MNADIVEATIDYLSQAMADSLGVTATNLGVYSDFAPGVPEPYAVVVDPDESYSFESSGLADGGYPTAVITNGVLSVVFVASSKVEVRALVRLCARLLCDTVVELHPDDGPVLELRPTHSQSIPVADVGPGVPTVFKRVLFVQYRQEYLQ